MAPMERSRMGRRRQAWIGSLHLILIVSSRCAG
jgi:hypothetical protein